MFWCSDVQLATSFPVFERELAGAPNLRYTGYLRDPRPAPWPRPVPDRLVIAYGSSSPWGTRWVLDALDEAARRVGAVVWCVLRADTATGRFSDRCEVFGFLPVDTLLPDAAGLIFHGGLSTALAAMSHGTPALAVPGRHYERRHNAERPGELGVGIAGEMADLRPSRLAGILAGLLDDDQMRSAAMAARESTAGYPGAPLAAEAIEALAR